MPLHILHVDDEPTFIELAEISIQQLADDVELTTTTSAKEAAALLDSEEFDCIVSDYVTTRDGDSFVEIAHQKAPDTPVILLSGKDLCDLPNQTVRNYLTDYLCKGQADIFLRLLDRINRHVDLRHSTEIRRSYLGNADLETTSIWSLDLSHAPATRLREILADMRECTADDLPLLFPGIDGDALEAIFANTHPLDLPGTELRFQFAGFDVLIVSDGTVYVRDKLVEVPVELAA